MNRMLTLVNGLVWEDDGQDLVEYGLLVLLIVIACVAMVGTVGGTVNNFLWVRIANAPF
jgi:Flp pilus assembly pilin Flp